MEVDEEYSVVNLVADIRSENDEGTSTEEIAISAKTITPYVELLENMKKIYSNPDTTQSDKTKILTLIPDTWTNSEIQEHFPCMKHHKEKSENLIKNNNILQSPKKRKGSIFLIITI